MRGAPEGGRARRVFLSLLALNALVLAAAAAVPDGWPVVAGTLKAIGLIANAPGVLASALVLGDLDGRFGPQWAMVITWGFSVPWLALAAAALERSRRRSLRAP